ncbi:MAG: VWA domain-containing protein [Verrucomicrobia bacterium]|jgi:Ca-activated chloride channel family protein|nr:VWA domain-containing protein [Verrucomicrobiota bacterium]
MSFAHPYLLLLLLILPWVAWLKGRQGRAPAFVYSSVRILEGLTGARRSRAGQFLAALRWLGLAVLITALAQPQRTRSETTVRASGVDIVVALDLSGSMRAEDFELKGERVNRLTMAKHVLDGFIRNRPNDRIGLVAFATEAYTAAPLTLDHDFLQQNIDRLELGAIQDQSTAIGSGLSTAVNRLRDLESKSKIVVLMTDGQNNAGNIDPRVAAEAAAALGVKVYTIGVGTRGEAPVPVYFMGQKMYRQQPVDIDEDTLKAIADKTGGRYYRADNAERFQSIYEEIDRLEKTEAEVKKYTQYQELFGGFLGAGFGLLLLELLLQQTVWRRLP